MILFSIILLWILTEAQQKNRVPQQIWNSTLSIAAPSWPGYHATHLAAVSPNATKLVVAFMIAGLERSFVAHESYLSQHKNIIKPVLDSGGTVDTFICTEEYPPSHNTNMRYLRNRLAAVKKTFNVIQWITTDSIKGQVARERLLYPFVTTYERKMGPAFRFSHIVRMRPDLVWTAPLSLNSLHPRYYHTRARVLLHCPSRRVSDACLTVSGCAYRGDGDNAWIGADTCAKRGFDGFDTCAIVDDQFGVVPRLLSDLVFDPLYSKNNISTTREMIKSYGRSRSMVTRCRQTYIDPAAPSWPEGRFAEEFLLGRMVPFKISPFSFYVTYLKERTWGIKKPNSNKKWIC